MNADHDQGDQSPMSVSELIARYNLKITAAAVRRWITEGVSIHGKTVRLYAERIGAQWFVTPEAWEAYRAACNPDAAPRVPSPAREAARRLRAKEELARRLRGGR